VYVARNKTRQILSLDLHLGSRLPAYCTSMGKVLLSDLGRWELRDLMGAGPYERRGPNTISDLAELSAALDQVRARGYAINDEELVAGLRAVAAPVRGHTNEVIAAINISVPSVRVSLFQLEDELAPLVVETARQTSLTLGARNGP